jgi:histidinol-phosphatase (PHP family)
MRLPPDTHVHSEWSWDAMHGSMERTCDRAVQLGLPSIAFTEHLDHTVWTASTGGLCSLPTDHPVARFSDEEGRVTPPPFDVEGYLESLERCRSRFRSLRIFSGLEVGEPHRHRQAVDALLATAQFDRVVGSLHTLRSERGYEEPNDLFTHRAADEVVRDYLAEIARLVTDSAGFSILGHIDYRFGTGRGRVAPSTRCGSRKSSAMPSAPSRGKAGPWRSARCSRSTWSSSDGGARRAGRR